MALPKFNIYFLLILLSNFLGTINSLSIPSDWAPSIESFDALFSENDDGIIGENGYPSSGYTPLMGNGYFSHTQGVRSDTYFIAGVYNNQSTSPSHRARIPATMAFTIPKSNTTGTLLQMKEG